MDNSRFLMRSQALAGYYTLTDQEREAIEKAIAPLTKRPEKQWPKVGASRLKSGHPLYLLRIDESLRAVVQPTSEGQPEIVNFVRRETLLNFKPNGATAANS